MIAAEDLRQAFVVTSYEIRKYLRSRRLLGMMVLLALIIGLILGLPPALGSHDGSASPVVASRAAMRVRVWPPMEVKSPPA